MHKRERGSNKFSSKCVPNQNRKTKLGYLFQKTKNTVINVESNKPPKVMSQTCQSTSQSINQSVSQSINQSISLTGNQSIDRSISQSINQSIDQSINQSNNQ